MPPIGSAVPQSHSTSTKRSNERIPNNGNVKPSSKSGGNKPHKDGKKDSDRKSPEWERCIHAARWIPRAYDMYCNIDEVVRICLTLEQGKAMDLGDDDDDDNDDDDDDTNDKKKIKIAYKKIMEKTELSTIEHHKRVYQYLEEQAPLLISFIHKNKAQKRNALIHDMQLAISRARSDDASHLRPVIGSYAAPHPDKKAIHPPVPARGPKDMLGFHHPELAHLLCPIRHLNDMVEDPVETTKKIQNGAIKVTAQKNPAFLYDGDTPGETFNPDDASEGFLRGFLLGRVMKHIYTSPSFALLGLKAQSTRASNAKIHKMTQVDAYHIAYAAVHARFSICALDKFVESDSFFKFPDFYYRIVDFIQNTTTDTDWVNELLGHYNKLLFDNARGIGHATEFIEGDSDDDDMAIMRKQMAGRASNDSGNNFLATKTPRDLHARDVPGCDGPLASVFDHDGGHDDSHDNPSVFDRDGGHDDDGPSRDSPPAFEYDSGHDDGHDSPSSTFERGRQHYNPPTFGGRDTPPSNSPQPFRAHNVGEVTSHPTHATTAPTLTNDLDNAGASAVRKGKRKERVIMELEPNDNDLSPLSDIGEDAESATKKCKKRKSGSKDTSSASASSKRSTRSRK